MSSDRFANVRALAIPADATASFTFHDIDGAPTLVVRPALDANPLWLAANLDRVQRLAAQGTSRVTPELVAAQRREMREVFARTCVVTWSPEPLDSAGARVPFSTEVAVEFLVAMPDYLWQRLEAFATSPTTFRPTTPLAPIAKN